jgi:hypothetical protein
LLCGWLMLCLTTINNDFCFDSLEDDNDEQLRFIVDGLLLLILWRDDDIQVVDDFGKRAAFH